MSLIGEARKRELLLLISIYCVLLFLDLIIVNVGFTINMMIVSETVGTTVEFEFAVSDGVPRRETMFTVSVGDEDTALLGIKINIIYNYSYN